MSDSEQLVIYQLHIFILGISPMIWRRIKIRSDSTIADLQFMLICYGIEQVIIWLIEVLTLGQFKVTWGIKIFSTQCVIPNLHL